VPPRAVARHQPRLLMTLYQKKSFSVPATHPVKTLCAVHHIVKGKCLRCPHVVKEIVDSVPTDSEGAE
jgi:hypothetical protein